MTDTIRIRMSGQPPEISIDLGETGPLFGARLRSELDPSSRSDTLKISAGQFLANRGILRSICKQYGVGIEVDEAATQLLQTANNQRQQLDVALGGVEALGPGDVDRLLETGRFVRTLRDFQVRDLGRLLALPHGANFSVPGAGKTTVTYALYEAERLRRRVDRLLVVCPLSAFDAWTSEPAECFDPEPTVHCLGVGGSVPSNAEVLVVNYSKLLSPDHVAQVLRWAAGGPVHMVLDEVHRIKKGRAGAWGASCLDLSWEAERRDVLSGTPAPQHPSDLEALIEFLWPGQARRVLPPAAFDRIPSPDIGSQLARTLEPIHVRTRKSELELREPQMTVLELELHGLHREIYLAVTNQYSGAIPANHRDRTRLAEMRRIVMYLLEAATNPALLSVGSSVDDPPVFQHPRAPIPAGSNLVELLNQYGRYETPAKFRKLGELVRSNAEQGRKTLVWSNFVRNLEMLRRDLGTYRPAMIHGGVPAATSVIGSQVTREEELARFRGDVDCMVLLANPAAMSEGVSLHHTCHDAIYLERTFNAGQYLQSVDRIHRLGLDPDQETRITFLVTKDTIDQVVYRRVFDKARRLSEMLNDEDILTMALPDDDDLQDVTSGFGQPLDDDEDVAALFEHLRGTGSDGD